MSGEDLGINVNDSVKTAEAFGKLEKQIKGIGGTLHVTDKAQLGKISETAWTLSEQTGKPVVIVVRSPLNSPKPV